MKGNGDVYVTSTNILHLLFHDMFTQLPFLQYQNMMYSEGTHPTEIHRKRYFLYVFKHRQFLPLEESHAIINTTCAISTCMSIKYILAMHEAVWCNKILKTKKLTKHVYTMVYISRDRFKR